MGDHREPADEVRAWLVSMRGGSPFLSPADGFRLIQWLDQGVPVSAIALAIERASAARRARRARWPLGLGDASRYLKLPKVPASPVRPRRTASAVSDAIRTVDPDDPAIEGLAVRLSDLAGTAEEITRLALRAFSAFFEEKWVGLDATERSALLDAARAGYGEWLEGLAEGAQLALVEEAARDLLRSRYPALTAELVWNAMHPPEPPV